MPRKHRDIPYLVLSTAPSKKEAYELSKKLLAKKLAVCINVIYPTKSFFQWKGKNQAAREAVLIIKTTKSHLSKLERFILKHHSYVVPEIIGWPIAYGNKSYLDWIKESIS